MQKQQETAGWLNAVRDKTAFNARHQKIGGRYVIETRLFKGWEKLGEGETVQEAYAEARQHDLWESSWRNGNPVRAVAENKLGVWVLNADGTWAQEKRAA